MKKISLANLSQENLDKLQQSALLGGSLGSCICAHICAPESCSENRQQSSDSANLAVDLTDDMMETAAPFKAAQQRDGGGF